MGNPVSTIDRRGLLLGCGAMLLGASCCPEAVAVPAGGPKRPPPPVAPSEGPLASAPPESVGMSATRIDDVFARLEQRVHDALVPGFSAMVVRHGKIVGERVFGKKVRGGDEPMTQDTIFDLESMTKVLATSISAMILVERKALRLEDAVSRWLPDFKGAGKEKVTVRDMLRYSSGLPIDNQFFDLSREEIWKRMAETPLEYPPGTKVQYSDLTYRLLGRVIEAAAGEGLDVFARKNVWEPLGMRDTMFTPPAALLPRIAATDATLRRKSVVRGVLQDDQDAELGGVVGCDGVFSTAKDVAVFCQMLLAGGIYAGRRVLSTELTRALTTNQTPFVDEVKTDVSQLMNLLETPKGYGFELATRRFSAAGIFFSPGSYGKTGGAGTFAWTDPERGLVGVLLTNHGLPVPFDEPGWDRLIEKVDPGEFYNGLVNAVTDTA